MCGMEGRKKPPLISPPLRLPSLCLFLPSHCDLLFRGVNGGGRDRNSVLCRLLLRLVCDLSRNAPLHSLLSPLSPSSLSFSLSLSLSSSVLLHLLSLCLQQRGDDDKEGEKKKELSNLVPSFLPPFYFAFFAASTSMLVPPFSFRNFPFLFANICQS